MSDQDKIAASIKSGKYFAEGLDWYKEVFVYPLRHTSVMALFCTVLAIVTMIMSLYIYLSFPLGEEVQVLVPMRDTINFIPKVIPADASGKSLRQIVVEDLTKKYVMARESFILKRFNTDYTFILSNSSKDIFDAYYKFLNSSLIHNPDGSVQPKPEVRVDVSSIAQENDNKVTVTFIKSTYGSGGQVPSMSKWAANIEFYLSNYDFNEANTSKLDFIVTKYEAREVKGAAKK